ncbi:glycosyltransferase family 2 protein [Micromonospora sp. CPCC 206060]|uniref:glycosyltransferase family 2 protein n=1 Tax=Micromonospora sp. CPCC 206060 TaxID=3122406 RepID=UPI002FF20DB4
MTPLVSVIMVSYQTRRLILRALATLRDSAPAVPYEVIVVDNASTDGSAHAVRAEHPDVQVIRLARNIGFGRAVNVGAARARGGYLLLLNPDTEPVGDPVGALVGYARDHPGHRIYAGRTLHTDGTDDGRSVFGLPSLRGHVCYATGLSSVFRRARWANPEELPGLDRRVGGPVPAASGCLLLIDRALFTGLGGFTPDYFMYSEDVDLCHRAVAHGAQPVLVPAAQVVHVNGAASTGVRKRVMLLRGRITYLRLRWPTRRARTAVRLLVAGVALRALAARLSRRDSPVREVWRQRADWRAGWPPAASLGPVEILDADPAQPV